MTSGIRALAALFLASLVLSACNTIAGAGHDLRNAGAAVERAAERNN